MENTQIYLKYLVTLCFFLFILSGCHRFTPHTYLGYVEGRFTYIASPMSGQLNKLYVQRGMTIKQGDPLYQLDLQPQQAAYQQIQAQLMQAKAQVTQLNSQLKLNQAIAKRRTLLFHQGHVDKETLDRAVNDETATQQQLIQAQANVIALNAQLTQSQWNLQQKTLLSPKNALVYDSYFLPGEFVAANQPVLSLLAKNDLKAIFFVPASQLSKLTVGKPVVLHCDECPHPLKAKIAYISTKAEFAPPLLYSDERRDELVFKVEADFSGNDQTLHPGQPVKIVVPTTRE